MPLFPFLYPRTWDRCNSLRVAVRQPWWLELRDTTKSQQATELVWEVYWGTRRGRPLRGSRRSGGQEGLDLFYYYFYYLGRVFYLVTVVATATASWLLLLTCPARSLGPGEQMGGSSSRSLSLLCPLLHPPSGWNAPSPWFPMAFMLIHANSSFLN